jgi:hypothetical protein
MEKNKKEKTDKWNSLGFLDGLKGHVKPEIAALYECCKQSITLSGSTN